MSRKGKKPILIPENVVVEIKENNEIIVKGPLGVLTHKFHPDIIFEIKSKSEVEEEKRKDEEGELKAQGKDTGKEKKETKETVKERGNGKNKELMIFVKRPSDSKEHKSQHGLCRTLLANMIEGVTKGFTKELLVIGTGYRASVQGNILNLKLGHSHPIKVEIPKDIKITVNKNLISIFGIDKYKVGQIAANIRGFRPPNVYTGKGVRYKDEVVKLKEGKKGA